MLYYLRTESENRSLINVRVLKEDIRSLPSITNASIDVVISTSALHHLPNDSDLESTFLNISRILKPEGRFYLFDFGLLKSPQSRRLLLMILHKSVCVKVIEVMI